MEDCDNKPKDLNKKLKAMGNAFRHPRKRQIDHNKNVLLNDVSIYDDIMEANKDLKAGQFEKAGEIYGEIASSVFWGAFNEGLEFVQWCELTNSYLLNQI